MASPQRSPSAGSRPSADGTWQLLYRRRFWIGGLLLAFAVAYAVIPQLGIAGNAWQTLVSGRRAPLFGALLLLLLSYGMASGIYLTLSPRRLRLGPTYVVQMAGSFAGRVLPAGLGSISVSFLYLRRQKLGGTVAATVVAINNLLGMVGHALLALALIVLLPGQLTQISITWPAAPLWWAAAALSAAAVVLLIGLRRRVRGLAGTVLTQLGTYRRQPWRLALALGWSVCLTLCNVLILWLAAQAVGSPIDLVTALLALTAGVAAQTATPTPGGLGGVEAGLVAGLVVGHQPLSAAVATALAFRLINFWLPLIIGAAALLLATRRHYI